MRSFPPTEAVRLRSSMRCSNGRDLSVHHVRTRHQAHFMWSICVRRLSWSRTLKPPSKSRSAPTGGCWTPSRPRTTGSSSPPPRFNRAVWCSPSRRTWSTTGWSTRLPHSMGFQIPRPSPAGSERICVCRSARFCAVR